MSIVKSVSGRIVKSDIFKNSAWGLISNMLQTLFISIFFVITARVYKTNEFAHFLIATTIYQMIVAFSSMGLGQWFIREYNEQKDISTFTSKFLKFQIILGTLFYAVNIVTAFLIYPDLEIRLLSIILGTNIIFDNLIYALRTLNIAEERQRTTFSILLVDGFLKLVLGLILFLHAFSVINLSLLLLVVRFLTLNLFIKIGSSNTISLKKLWTVRVSFADIKHQILSNWRFVVIGSISVIYWRSANIIISKLLTLQDVANYEISYRIFALGLVLPSILSTTVFPKFIKYYNDNDIDALKKIYHNVFLIYNVFAFFAYSCIYTFANVVLPLAFGPKYMAAIPCLQQMFLTFILFPTVLLQANLIVAMKAERIDMKLNILSVITTLVFCLGGLYFDRSLSVINYSIFASFVIFHVLQNIFLLQRGLITIRSFIIFYVLIAFYIYSYNALSKMWNHYLIFGIYSLALLIFAAARLFSNPKPSIIVPEGNI